MITDLPMYTIWTGLTGDTAVSTSERVSGSAHFTHCHDIGRGGRIGRARASCAGDRDFGSWSTQTWLLRKLILVDS